MLISINNPVQATWVFSFIFFAVLVISVRPRKITAWFPTSLTTELKGAAILMIVLSHIGYFLVNDHRFLWPLSIMAGVGVNLFLFLSGFGLAASGLQKDLTPGQFYKRRLLKLFTPFWLALGVFLAADFFILGKSYSFAFIGKAILGVFTQADLYNDLNSPLWYFTFILLYYLLFPWVFSKKRPWIAALALLIFGEALVRLEPAFFDNVLHLYKVHTLAFPLGVLVAWAVTKLPSVDVLGKLSKGWRVVGYYAVLFGLLAAFIYANINSGIGQSASKEQWMSLAAVAALVLVFIMKKTEFKLFSLFGLYSYEIYLWHWPLLYRYNIFYGYLPDWLATVLYLVLFLGVGWVAPKVVEILSKRKKDELAVK
jgi:peptidoglycan/LPS O-acetylase OafA/YrhL